AANPRSFTRRNGAASVTRGQWWHRQRTRSRRPGQSPAPQDRAQPGEPAVCADGARHWLSTGDQLMTSLDITNGVRNVLTRLREAWEWYDAIPPIRKIHSALGQVADGWRRASRWVNSVMPKGLYARALLIIIAPMVILQSVIAFIFMERHW